MTKATIANTFFILNFYVNTVLLLLSVRWHASFRSDAIPIKPAIIDLYADWCGPCRMTAPIMKSLAKEYDGKIVIYKVNVDKEKELAALFNATSIPLFVFIPMNGEPQLFRGAADKATYQKAIDEFLLK